MINNEIKVLSDKDHIILRSGMYIGSNTKETHRRFLFGQPTELSYVPGLIKIIDEVIDNSVDEAIRTDFKFANKISIEINTNENKVTVTDNGRGIPQADVVLQNNTTVPGPVAAWTVTKAGGNFEGSDRKTSGMNGVGSSLTNIFSTLFIGTTSDGKKEITVHSKDGTDDVSWDIIPSAYKGTKVVFYPNPEHFENNRIDEVTSSIILDRLHTLAVVYPQIEFKFNNKKIVGNFKTYAESYAATPVIAESKNCSIAFCTTKDGFTQQSFVNNIHTIHGGTHVDYIINSIADELIPKIKKVHKIDITKARIKENICLIAFIRDMSNMRFDSQTKERFTSPLGEVKNHIDIDFKKLALKFFKTKELIDPIIQSVLARALAAEKAAATKAKKAKVPKHIKANKTGNANYNTTLHLTEGDSALGFLLETRDRDLHGGYPLRGKFLSTYKLEPVDMLKNKEVFEILGITGLVIGKPVDFNDIQYQNIAIMTDADHDGKGSICPSLLSFLSNWPELFEQGRVKIVQSPVWICKKGSSVKWYYREDDYEKHKEELTGYDIRYIKGLGSLERDEYETVINSPRYHIVKLDENWQDLFELLYGSDTEKRKVWIKS